jgi:hypothetical protein
MSWNHRVLKACSDIEIALQQINAPLEIAAVLVLMELFELHLIELLELSSKKQIISRAIFYSFTFLKLILKVKFNFM